MRAEGRGRKSEVRDQRSEIRGRRSEVGDQRSEIRDRRSEIRDQRYRSPVFHLRPDLVNIINTAIYRGEKSAYSPLPFGLQPEREGLVFAFYTLLKQGVNERLRRQGQPFLTAINRS